MPRPPYIELNGKRYLWREVIDMRRQQLEAARNPPQPTLFVLREDHKPACEGSAALRYQEPSLLSLLSAPASV